MSDIQISNHMTSEDGRPMTLLLKGKDCADLCSVSLRTWQRWVKAGEAPRPVYINHAPRWVAAEIEAWVVAKWKSRRKVVV
jgi:predicted DNA-binding transcriptional regulator AlpA